MEGSQRKLQRGLMKKSKNKTDWEIAKHEWSLLNVYMELSECECGHHIVENCVIRNIHTNEEAIVGNCCIRHFKRDDLSVEDKTYASLRKLQEDPQNSTANAALLKHAVELNILTQSDADFYTTITTGRGARTHFDPSDERYSPSKAAIRYEKNKLMEMGFQQSRPRCRCNQPSRPKYSQRTNKYFYSCPNWTQGGGGCGFYQAA